VAQSFASRPDRVRRREQCRRITLERFKADVQGLVGQVKRATPRIHGELL
jgi:hypothetical protein